MYERADSGSQGGSVLAASHKRPAEVVASEHPAPCVTRACQHSFMSGTHTTSAPLPGPAPVLGAQSKSV